MRADIYDRITREVVSDLEKGGRPGLKPWQTERASKLVSVPLRGNGIPYRGINVLMLGVAAAARGYDASMWMTVKQAQARGGHVHKGERGCTVVYASTIARSGGGEDSARDILRMRRYTVFNVEQIEGLPAHYYPQRASRPDPIQRVAHAEAFFAATRVDIRHRGNRAYYSDPADFVQIPPFPTFPDAESYYATLAHETVHWTRHPSRLNREFGRKRWGDEGYAMEELVAELGAAFLCADLNLTPETRPDYAAYLASWIEVLKNDKRAIFTAASYAQRAVDFLHGLQPAARASS